jgi:hypothetical protein
VRSLPNFEKRSSKNPGENSIYTSPGNMARK